MPQENETPFQIKFRWIYLIGIFLILIQILNILPPWFIPTGWGKTICFRIIFSILLSLFILQILFGKVNLPSIKKKLKSVSLLFCLLIFLLGIYLISTIFSVDPKFSLWGEPSRSGGFLNFSFYIVFAIFAFLVIQKNDWPKVWAFSVFIGILVSVIAIFQQFGLFEKVFIPFRFRPVSTLGNALLLALYLVILIFPTLSFAIKSKKISKRIFYWFAFFLFLVSILFLAKTRGVFIGLALGLIWFLVFYPKKSKKFKIYSALFLILGILAIYFLNGFLKSNLDIYTNIYRKIPFPVNVFIDRTLSLFDGSKIMESRLSTWKVSWQALKEKPILGWGPENFMLAFDKHYDPSLPYIGPSVSPGELILEWWDRAHNFMLDIPISAGSLALIIYLALFAALMWKLQKAKKYYPNLQIKSEPTNDQERNGLVCHGIQAAFIGYLAGLFFSFDCFATYLMAFLLIGYSLHLISKQCPETETSFLESPPAQKPKRFLGWRKPAAVIVSIALSILLIWFIWVFNLKPLIANKNLQLSYNYAFIFKNCQKSLTLGEDIFKSETIIDSYLQQGFAEIIQECSNRNNLEQAVQFSEEALYLLRKNTQNHPNRIQAWVLWGQYVHILMEFKNMITQNTFVPSQEMFDLKNEANMCFERAHALSPKRQSVYTDWAKTGIITEDYKDTKAKTEECLKLNQNYMPCLWLGALAEGYLGDLEGFDKQVEKIHEMGYHTESLLSYQQLANLYIKLGNYERLSETYPKIIAITPDSKQKAQHYASLAVVYRELGRIKEAREAALKALELQPEAKPIVDEFLKTLE